MFTGIRLHTLTYVYDDPEHPDRPTSAISSPQWTPDDRGLLMGLEAYEASLCRCGFPKEVAWHSEMDGGWFEADEFVCHACSAREGSPVAYVRIRNTRPESKGPMPPFVLGVSTTGREASPAAAVAEPTI